MVVSAGLDPAWQQLRRTNPVRLLPISGPAGPGGAPSVVTFDG